MPPAVGPIPAGAGEPGCGGGDGYHHGAYPRGCGGADLSAWETRLKSGLSPRVRGSLRTAVAASTWPGPIPAGAGEPVREKGGREWLRAYPRGCGGATMPADAGGDVLGLSPRVRGSRSGRDPAQGAQGPIPAGAGEPDSDMLALPRQGAYPRGCGGASHVYNSFTKAGGLSPRVRGSPTMVVARRDAARPIPAGAGEPLVLRHLKCLTISKIIRRGFPSKGEHRRLELRSPEALGAPAASRRAGRYP